MRFMLILKANADSEAGAMPSTELINAMGAYNAELAAAGVLLAGEGLLPSSRGVRVHFSGGTTTVTDGPFTEAKELVGGFWMLRVESRDEAVAWARRCPAPHGPDQDSEIEVRQVIEAEDFPEDVFPSEARAREQRLRDKIAESARDR